MDSPEQRARLSAVVSIFGAVNALVVYMANRWWRTQHPQPVIAGGEDSGLHPDMMLALLVTLLAFTLLYFCLWKMGCDLERSRESVESLRRTAQRHLREVR